MNRDDVLRRIKKCMAMGSSPNEHEAAAALRQAQKLMTAYGVTEQDVVAAEIRAEGVKSLTATRNPAGWEMRLASLLSEAFALAHYLRRGYCYIPVEAPRQIVLAEWVYIGPADRVVMACYTHQVLGRQVIKAKDKYLAAGDFITRKERIAAGESFCEGFISNIRKQVSAMSNEAPVNDAIKRLKTEHLGGEGETIPAPRRGLDFNAYLDGAAAGRDAYLNKPMPGAAVVARLE